MAIARLLRCSLRREPLSARLEGRETPKLNLVFLILISRSVATARDKPPVDTYGDLHNKYSNITDLTGELEDRQFATTRGDSRIAMTITRNKYTVNFNRENRFLIDDPDTKHKLSYQLTKPLKLGAAYNGKGVFKFVLQEVTATEYDNHELGIADYYKSAVVEGVEERIDEKSGKKVWL